MQHELKGSSHPTSDITLWTPGESNPSLQRPVSRWRVSVAAPAQLLHHILQLAQLRHELIAAGREPTLTLPVGVELL